jgi:hypothetical protein
MELMLDEDEYLPISVAAGAGFRVALTPSGKRPNPAEEGFFIQPGTEVDLAFRLQTSSRQPPPYESLCWDKWKQTPYQPLYIVGFNQKRVKIEDYSYDVSVTSPTTLYRHYLCLEFQLKLGLIWLIIRMNEVSFTENKSNEVRIVHQIIVHNALKS